MEYAMTTSPRATPLGHQEQHSFSWSSVTADVNSNGAAIADDNAQMATVIGRSPSPGYFGLNIDHSITGGTSSVMDIDMFGNSSSARNFVPGFPTQPFNPATTHDMNMTAMNPATSTTGFSFSRLAFEHNTFQSQNGAQRRPPMPRYNTMPSVTVYGHATPNSDACSPRTSNPGTSGSATETMTMPSQLPAADRSRFPFSAMPSFKYEARTMGQPESIPEQTEIPMDVDTSPFFANTAPAMNLSLPSGRGFSLKKSSHAAPQTPAAVLSSKPRPLMKIAMPPPPPTMHLNMPLPAMTLNTPGAPKPPLTPKAMARPALKLNLGLATSPGAVPRGTPVSAVATTKMFATVNFIDGKVLNDLMVADPDQVLLLDVRCSQNFAISHIRGALNLCVPTMLLKRDKFKLQKLIESFQKPSDVGKLSRWQACTTIIAYGSCSSDKNEVTIAQNVLNKFVKEGFNGRISVLGGGFAEFAEHFSRQIEEEDEVNDADPATPPANALPVFGGVNIPSGPDPNAAFFGTIRQNMDLVGGVGKAELTRPAKIAGRRLPRWLNDAYRPEDDGKEVAEKFRKIEVEEKDRMKAALTVNRPGVPPAKHCLRLSGFEKGGKNRYKDVLPFDHARVKLQGKVECDYINASYVKSSRSNKRYIASQGPLPATFDDFWSVVWDNDVRLVINLTAEQERGHIKCHPYWNENRYGQITVKKVSEINISLDLDPNQDKATRTRSNTTMSYEENPPMPSTAEEDSSNVIVRYFAVSHAGKPFEPLREIVQLHYSGWPDFGAPTKPSHLLALVELANIINRQLSHPETAHSEPPVAWQDEVVKETSVRPVLVHCSAGCGRTGTFCTIDSVIDMMKRQRMEDKDLVAQRSPADTAATTVAAQMGINAPHSPRSVAATRSMASVFGSPTAADRQTRQRSNSRRGSTTAPPPAYSPLDLQYMNDESVDLVRVTVDDFRRQRLSMVQTLRQYSLCYNVVMEWISRLNDHMSPSSVIGSRIRLRKQSLDGMTKSPV